MKIRPVGAKFHADRHILLSY